MKRIKFLVRDVVLAVSIVAVSVCAHKAHGQQPYDVGNPLSLPVQPTADEAFEPISSNVTVYGAIYDAAGSWGCTSRRMASPDLSRAVSRS